MKKYEIVERMRELRYVDRMNIEEGCTNLEPDQELIKSFDSLEEAKEELKKYKTTISKFSAASMRYFEVTEYCVEENEYDEDGELESEGAVWEYSKMEIEVVESETYNTLAVCSSYREAEEIADQYDGDREAIIMF